MILNQGRLFSNTINKLASEDTINDKSSELIPKKIIKEIIGKYQREIIF